MAVESQNPDAYELIVQSLLATQLGQNGIGNLTAHHLKKYRGKSGQEHEIDVSFEIMLGEIKLLFLVECKAYNRRVGVDEITTFVYRLRDIGAHKGLLVTTIGFQEGAARIAKAEGVGLLLVANGHLSHYMGATYTVYELWINQLCLTLGMNSDGILEDISLIGTRLVVGNCFSSVSPLSVAVMSRPKDLAFLLPNEVGTDFGSDRDEAHHHGREWGRVLHSGARERDQPRESRIC